MRTVGRAVILCCGVIASSIGPALAQSMANLPEPSGQIDLDPLRKFLPREDIFMPVPGGVLAVESDAKPEDSVEQRRENRNGGIIVGYCLRASCSHVTHLAVLQVCGNQLGGPDGINRLILGIIRLPYGETPGYLMSLRGRDYAANFSSYGPFVQPLTDTGGTGVFSLYSLSAKAMGPVAALEFQGLQVKDDQRPETVALQMEVVRVGISGPPFARFAIRHYCRQQLS